MLKMSIKPSRQLVMVLCVAHAAAAGALLLLDLLLWLKIPLVLLIVTSCAACLYGPALLRSEEAIVGLVIRKDGGLSLQTRRGEWRDAMLLGSSFVSPHLAILNVRTEKSLLARHVVIMPDSVDADGFRQLRVWLRWRKTGTA